MSYHHILVPVDGSELSFSAVRHAAEIAKTFKAKLTLISIVAEDPFTDPNFKYYYSPAITRELFIQAYQNAENILEKASAIASYIGVSSETKVIQASSKTSIVGDAIIQTTVQLPADLIVMGSNDRKGFRKMLLGNVAAEVMRSTQLPVLVVKS